MGIHVFHILMRAKCKIINYAPRDVNRSSILIM
jgi:hypothetical protein